MKRAFFVVLVLILLVGVIVSAQSLTLKWKTNLHILPTLAMDYTSFEVVYSFAEWKITTDFKYRDMEFIDLSFQVQGKLGPVDIDAGMVFDPLEDGYESAHFSAKLTSLPQLDLSFRVQHYADWTCDSQTSSYMLYTLASRLRIGPVASISAKLRFDEFCTGITFKDVSISIDDGGFLCGTLYDAELSFTKTGFGYFDFSVDNVFTAYSWLSFDFAVQFGLDYKEVSIESDVASLDFCGAFSLYLDVPIDPDTGMVSLAVYGLKMSLTLSECNKVEIVTALVPGKVPGSFKEDEIQYIKCAFCAPGCCGPQMKGGFQVFFKEEGIPLGISRVVAKAEIPITSSFTVDFLFESPGTLDVGWTLTF